MSASTIRLEDSWKIKLQSEFTKSYMQDLRGFLISELQAKKPIYPPPDCYFKALDLTPFDQVKVVILGQDPYHGAGQAHGLSFSVPTHKPPPPSLVNIFKELESDLGLTRPTHGCLEAWARQGVLLLNSVLSVEEGHPGAHQNRGWELFTDAVIQKLAQEREHLVFILWGSYAQRKASFIDAKKHLFISSVHPSPLSAYRGFFGSKPFSKANDYLTHHGMSPINWQLGAIDPG